MTTTIKKLFVLLVALSCMGVSCTDDFEEINTDPNRIEKISPGTLLNPIIYEMASFNTSRSDAYTFEVMQVALPFPSASGGEHRYDVGDNAGSSTWNTYYRWLTNIKEMQEAAVTAEDRNYQAIALTLNAWVYSLLTDSFGDVPMIEASRGDEGIFYPTFNTQQEIYTKILSDLDIASQLFDPSKSMIYGTDILYGNKVENWQRFCNSLYLRLLLRISKKQESASFTKMAEIINNPTQYPVFTSNAEAAILKISGVPPLVSPWGRAVDFRTGKAASAFFIDNLNTLNDPRQEKFFTKATLKDGKTQIGYKGIPSGYEGSDAQFDYIPSTMNIALVTAPMISVIMSYAEVEFIKAELAQKGIINSNAQTHYESGVKAAIEQWGATIPTNYFNNSAATYDGTFEKIMLQKYLALYFNDYQQWFEYRRTGFPELPKTNAMVNNKMVPVRFKYPSTVQISNGNNYRKAVEQMGGDNINTKVWWEK
ncbi:SusD/RagB family nutrient-binding outer membrane lipoprotein [Pontibacter sp. SGAir0037]|uniref:SusD/RagB family nutrient-binding outer membrane lipoprotein n=1 Tax=Pontibacter sp. SGAir0037 TaxID=2571030 RepID=UPI0010CD3D70|nr:SusD/RagB family nutrient-binding outer membrane lipoprotein [Pontibacter sp. SGAir0037]QCR24690.1 SusD/RagB family nutrient-binding outer membrane lipoprotein [Pontibacter sp. SGAir0037]